MFVSVLFRMWFTNVFVCSFIDFNVANMNTPAKPEGTRMQIGLCLCFFIIAVRTNLIRTSRFQVLPLLLVCLVVFHFSYSLQAEPCKIKPINCLQNVGLN